MAGFWDWMSHVLRRSGCWGLSLGSSSLKWASLKPQGRGWVLDQFHSERLPEEVFVKSEVRQASEWTQWLQKGKKALPPQRGPLYTSLNGPTLFLKKMNLGTSSSSQDSWEEQLTWELQQWMPFESQDWVVDFFLSPDKKKPSQTGWVAGIKKTILAQTIECLKSSEMYPQAIECDFLAMQRIFEWNYPWPRSEAVCLIDVGDLSVKILFLSQGFPVLAQELPFGSRQINEAIQKKLNLSYWDSETLKLSLSQPENLPVGISEIVSAVIDRWFVEWKKIIQYYQTSQVGPSLSACFLMGGGVLLPDFSEQVEEKIGLPTQILNPFRSLKTQLTGLSESDTQKLGPLAAIPIGLALRGIRK